MNNQVDVVDTVRRKTCLDPYIESFKDYLKDQSYSPTTIRAYCIRARRLAMVMESRSILPSCLTTELAIELAHGEGRNGGKAYSYATMGRKFAKHLFDLGVVLAPSPTPQQIARKEIQLRFEDYLHRHRGLSQRTISQSWCLADRFLDHRFGDTDINLAAISVGDVIAFLQMAISKKAPSRSNTATYLRNFLRYLFKHGLTASNLALCVPRVTKRYNARLPRYLSPDQVETVLAAVRANPTHGQRNHAMLLLQARLGLRAPEVMAIQLDDINWRVGELIVRGKGQRHDRLPIPPDVGEALTAYIRHDRVSTSRALFVTLRKPYGPFKSGHMLNNILKKAFAATGVKPPSPYVGSHVLRHSLATNMVRNGASLAEVSDMLRHRCRATTMIYAKLDLEGLRSIAQSWPAVGGVQ